MRGRRPLRRPLPHARRGPSVEPTPERAPEGCITDTPLGYAPCPATPAPRTTSKRLRRIEGQVRGLQRMIEEDVYCIDVLDPGSRRLPTRTCRASLRLSPPPTGTASTRPRHAGGRSDRVAKLASRPTPRSAVAVGRRRPHRPAMTSALVVRRPRSRRRSKAPPRRRASHGQLRHREAAVDADAAGRTDDPRVRAHPTSERARPAAAPACADDAVDHAGGHEHPLDARGGACAALIVSALLPRRGCRWSRPAVRRVAVARPHAGRAGRDVGGVAVPPRPGVGQPPPRRHARWTR